MNASRVIIAGTHSGVGKTTFTLGIILALKKRGLSVQSYKTGPDYIDPGYHSYATGRSSRNLDSMLLSRNRILEFFERCSRKVDISIIEGVMGLFDGVDAYNEKGSTSHLAKILKAPVILILDARAMSRSAAAVAYGFSKFERGLKISGFLLNKMGSKKHFKMVKESMEKKTGIPVMGYLPRDEDLRLPERHLGLVPAWEKKVINSYQDRLSKYIQEYIDIEAILKIAQKAPPFPSFKKSVFTRKSLSPKVTIALALDEAFHFYYEDNLDILKHYGAKIVTFSPLKDRKLPPETDGIYIGGGFPELFAEKLSSNFSLKEEIYKKAMRGMPIYAECGGLMYLIEKLSNLKEKEFSMVGILPGEVKMGKKLRALGYCKIKLLRDTILGKKGECLRGHIFHWSYLTLPREKIKFAYKIEKSGKSFYDGLLRNNILASYVHIHFGSKVSVVKNLIGNCIRSRNLSKVGREVTPHYNG